MYTTIEMLASSLLSAVLCLLMLPAFAWAAKRVGLVDRPEPTRHHHVGEVPMVGGMSIFMAAFVAVSVVHFSISVVLPLLVGVALLILGAVDDRIELSTRIRFPVQALTAVAMIVFGHIGIESVGNLFGYGAVIMGTTVSLLFTIMCTVGAINSINMIDGVDGLSGSIIGITLGTLAFFSYQAGDMSSVVLLMALMSAICVFLLFNSRLFRSSALVFMGDAGSTFFGFLLVWFFIQLTQGESAQLSPVAAGWIFGVPLMDTVSVMVRRLLQRRSPFSADRIHLHHLLLDAGLKPNQVVLSMSLGHFLLILIGALCNALPDTFEPIFFWGFVALVILHFFATPRLLKLRPMGKINGDHRVYGS